MVYWDLRYTTQHYIVVTDMLCFHKRLAKLQPNNAVVLSSWTNLVRQLMTKMTAKCSLSFVVVVVVQCEMTEGGFSPVKWSPSLSEQCGEHGSPELSAALTTVAEMIVSDQAPTSLPKSCMEIKESSPVSPSGHYTISDGSSSDSAVVVYCNMDDLSSFPALEQTLSGFKKDVELLFSRIDSPLASVCIASSCLEVKERCPQCESGMYEIASGGASFRC